MAYRHIVKSIRHSISETDYRIKIAIPKEPAPEEGYPVFYILDGNAYGVLFESVVMLQAQRTEKTGVPLAVIVSIGYAQEEIFSPLRIYDFTPQSEVVNLPERPSGVPWPTSWRCGRIFKGIKKSETNGSTRSRNGCSQATSFWPFVGRTISSSNAYFGAGIIHTLLYLQSISLVEPRANTTGCFENHSYRKCDLYSVRTTGKA